ncbi:MULTISPECIES: ParB/RepB/Spo0J family partition protein [unclassified Shewanella]|uniref:ParB/RepB/Spo0J family partition protein n=1 Tax=unclassified Shewanella TaxID=196818 RepID=UPI0021D94A8A|nr:MULTISPECIES: ParB/RepB/Spo0J family partition protein [unclassified Shewanella]MCU8036418.1 ParB N-terminal domain-containing protein [Shewanella sp. SM71]MCU8098365.1 ParB N-terminal domain-containing protein [Shewanella sp. SM102]
MTNSIQAQATHTKASISPTSHKTKAGSHKPDIAQKSANAVVALATTAKPVLLQLQINQLVLSELNVRKGDAAKEDDEQLYASILAHGILQNLIVEPMNAQGLYPVLGGGRRLRQLIKAVKSNKLKPTALVPVKLLTAEDVANFATELSLTENFMRANMHPVDEFHAFADMVNKGASIADVAARFGVKAKFVQQRMKLSMVAPVVLDAYKAGNVSLDIVMVFTIASVEKQVEVWELVGDRRYNENQFRNMLKEAAVSAEHYLAQFVGQDEYEKAGGVVTSDLFSDEVYLDDKALLEALATAKLEIEAAKLIARGWKWADVKLVSEYDELAGFGLLDRKAGEYDAAEMALAGCLLVLKSYGEPVSIYMGLVRKDDKKALAQLQASAQVDSLHDGDVKKIEDKDASGYSAALNDDLRAQRLIIAKHALMSAPSVALDTLHFSVCASAFTDSRYGSRPLHLSVNDTTCHPKTGQLTDNKAVQLIEDIKASFNLVWAGLSTVAERFNAFCVLDVKEKEKQVAYATAMMFEASIDSSHQAVEAVISTLDVKWSNYWRPTAETFFKRVSVPILIDMAQPVMGEQWALQAATLKKKDLATQVDSLVNGERKGLDDAQKAYFDALMPAGF